MGLFFLGDQRADFVAMVKEVTERVVDLGLGQTQIFADFLNRFAALMERSDLPNRHAQSVHDRLSAANTGKPDDAQDIEGHLKGGIPNADMEALADYWRMCPTLKDSIFKSSARRGYSELQIAAEEVSKAILSHKEFATFRTHVLGIFTSIPNPGPGVLQGYVATVQRR